MTKFMKWLKDEGIKQSDAAKALGLTQGQVSRIATGGTASLDVAIKIRDYTNGNVSVDDLGLLKKDEPA